MNIRNIEQDVFGLSPRIGKLVVGKKWTEE